MTLENLDALAFRRKDCILDVNGNSDHLIRTCMESIACVSAFAYCTYSQVLRLHVMLTDNCRLVLDRCLLKLLS